MCTKYTKEFPPKPREQMHKKQLISAKYSSNHVGSCHESKSETSEANAISARRAQ